MTKFYDPAQVRLAQLEGEIQRVTKFGTWEGWSPEDTNYLLGELRNRLVEDCPFPSHDELVAIAIEARQSALGGTPSEEEVLRSLLRFALTKEGLPFGRAHTLRPVTSCPLRVPGLPGLGRRCTVRPTNSEPPGPSWPRAARPAGRISASA